MRLGELGQRRADAQLCDRGVIGVGRHSETATPRRPLAAQKLRMLVPLLLLMLLMLLMLLLLMLLPLMLLRAGRHQFRYRLSKNMFRIEGGRRGRMGAEPGLLGPNWTSWDRTGLADFQTWAVRCRTGPSGTHFQELFSNQAFRGGRNRALFQPIFSNEN